MPVACDDSGVYSLPDGIRPRPDPATIEVDPVIAAAAMEYLCDMNDEQSRLLDGYKQFTAHLTQWNAKICRMMRRAIPAAFFVGVVVGVVATLAIVRL